MKVLLAIIPVLIVLIGLGPLKLSSVKVAPVAMVVAMIIGVYGFGTTWGDLIVPVFLKRGVFEGLKAFFMISGAYSLLRFMQMTGAIEKIKSTISDLTHDKRAHVIIIAIFLGTFFEGAAGSGTPAAICAPLLVGLGYEPMTAAVVCLIANCVPVSWGAAGLTTIMPATSTDINKFMTVLEASGAAGKMHMIGALVIMFIAIWFVFGKKGFKGMGPYLIINSILYAGLIALTSHTMPEIVGIATGMLMVAINILLFKVFKFKTTTPDEFVYEPDLSAVKSGGEMSAVMAFIPYILLCICIPVVRFSLPLPFLAKIGFTTWVGCTIYIVIFLSSLIVPGGRKVVFRAIGNAFKSVWLSGIAIVSMVTLAAVMNGTGMTQAIANFLTGVGGIYPAFAVLIGVLGSFVSGTAATSNNMFGAMHCYAAVEMQMNPIPVFGAQNAGGALGNMICPFNVVQVATTTGMPGQEGKIMKRVLPAFCIVLVLYMALALLYTHALFPFSTYPGMIG